MMDVIKYVKHFYHSENGELIEKMEAGFMLMKMYQELNKKCTNRKELRTSMFENLLKITIEYGEQNLDQKFVT